MLTLKYFFVFNIFLVKQIFCNEDYRFFNRYPNFSKSNETFSKFYLKSGESVFYNVSQGDVYFPKCCPPDYLYENRLHKCVQDQEFTVYNYLDCEVKLIGSGLQNCEVIVDFSFYDIYQMKKRISFHGTTLIFDNRDRFDLGRYCLDIIPISEDIVVRLCYNKEYCTNPEIANKRCLRKCCADGTNLRNRMCVKDPTVGIDLTNHTDLMLPAYDEFAIWNGKLPCETKIIIDNFHIKDGYILLNNSAELQEFELTDQTYCIDHIIEANKTELILLHCVASDIDSFIINRSMNIISVICLLLTIILLGCKSRIPLLDKVIISYCFALLMFYIRLALLQFGIVEISCKFSAYTLTFFFIAIFCWMSVLCYDIWKSFSIRDYNKYIFLKYHIFAWSVPSVFVLLVLIFNFFPLPDVIHPYIGITQCMLENRTKAGNYGHFIFFLMPSVVAITYNTIMFVRMLRLFCNTDDVMLQLYGEEDETQKHLRKALKLYRKRVFMGLKLFIILGISWSFEIVSSLISFKTNYALSIIEIILDACNCLQGFFIFIVFNYKFIIRMAKQFCCKNRISRKEESVEEEDLSEAERHEMATTNIISFNT